MHEVEQFVKSRQLKDEPRGVYLIRVARAVAKDLSRAADRLSPQSYAWAVSALDRIRTGDYPYEFDDSRVRASLSDQLMDLLEQEDLLERKISERPKRSRPGAEQRNSDYSRIAQYILSWPGASDNAVASELGSTGWKVTSRRVAEVRAELRRVVKVMRTSGITLRGADGDRILAI